MLAQASRRASRAVHLAVATTTRSASRSESRSSSCAVLHPVALVLLVSIPFPEDALLPKFAGAVSVLPDVSSELLSTIPLTFAPGEVPLGYNHGPAGYFRHVPGSILVP